MPQQPFDPLNPPNLGIGLRAGMFGSAMQCPKCGFATSDDKLYECPNCQMAWRAKPVEAEKPQAGQAVSLECAICGQPFTDGRTPVFTGKGTQLAHEPCLAGYVAPTLEAPQGLLTIIEGAPPEGSESVAPTTTPARKKRRRRRKKKPAAAAGTVTVSSEKAEATE